MASEAQQKGTRPEDVGLRGQAVDEAGSSHAGQLPLAPGTRGMPRRAMWFPEQAPFWSQAAMDPASACLEWQTHLTSQSSSP